MMVVIRPFAICLKMNSEYIVFVCAVYPNDDDDTDDSDKKNR